MTDTSINGLVNPQDFGTGVADGDEDYISAGYHTLPKPATGCIVNGCGFTPNFTTPNVDIAPGVVQVPDTGIAVQSGSQTTYDTTLPNEAFQHVIIPSTVTIPLDDGVVNEIWIAARQSNQDDVFIRHGNGLSEPSEPSVKIGEVDTSGDTVSEQWGLVAGDNVLTYPSVSVAESERSSLPDGTVVYARDTSEHIVSGIDAASVSASDSITDPAGNTFTDLSDPVRVTEDSVTFAESDVTVTTSGASIDSGSITLLTAEFGTSATAGTDNNSIDISTRSGVTINPNINLEGVRAQISANTSGVTKAYLHEYADPQTLLDTTDISTLGPGDTFRLEGSLSSDTRYYVTVDAEGSNYTRGYDDSPSFPYTSSDIDIDGSANAIDGTDVTSSRYTIQRVTAMTQFGAGTSGDALVEWDTGVPADINSWDLATFQETLDGETVTVDVEDGNGNVLFSDIGQNFDISTVDTSKNVKLRANLSRSDTSNNPALDYAARRFTR